MNAKRDDSRPGPSFASYHAAPAEWLEWRFL